MIQLSMYIKYIKTTIWLIAIFLVAGACNRNTKDEYAEEIKSVMQTQMTSLKSKEYFKDSAIRNYLKTGFEEFYTNRNYQLAWLTSEKLLPHTDSLLKAIEQAADEGLVAENYDLDQIRTLQQEIFDQGKISNDSLGLQQLVKLDFLMTSAYMTYGAHLLAGRIVPEKLDSTWIVYPRKKNLARHLEQALKNNRVGQSLQELSPLVPQYGQLKKQLATHRTIMKAGGWPVIPAEIASSKLNIGQAIAALKRRLGLSGDLDTTQSPVSSSPAMDDQMVAALKKFQTRCGLEPNGKLTKEIIAFLNEPVEKRIQQIELNMERIRWMPDSIGTSYLLVNIPAFKLTVYEKNAKKMEMNVIVGKEYAATPIFTDTLEHIVFSPDWTVPPSIAKNEILPILQKNPDYLAEHDMVVYTTWNAKDTTQLDPHETDWNELTPETFNYRIVQKPGEKNPLGRVKFMLPNDLFIYLHDTPGDHLFNRKERAFSHGCIRLEQPAELAAYLLGSKDGWSLEKVNEYMNKEEPVTVELPRHLPIQLVYRTAWVDEQGMLNFRSDIYGYDDKQIKAITRKEDQLQKMANVVR